MTIAKKVLIALGVLLVLSIGALVALPFLFKDKIVAFAKTEINESLRAKVEFGDVSLSLLRSFPDFSFELQDLRVTGTEEFEGIELMTAKAIGFTLDIMSVIKSDRDLEVNSVTLSEPNITVLVLKGGKANYDITIPAEELPAEAQESAFKAQLERYSIADGHVVYDDRDGDMYLEMKGLNHSGSGQFTLDVYDLVTQSEVAELTAKTGGITYLKKAKSSLEATFNINQTTSKYTLKENRLRINELVANADGYVQLTETDDIVMDLTFSTPQNDFKSLLSMVPNAYTAGYEQVKAEGKFDLAGMVKGTYNGLKEQYPAFKFDFSIENGSVKYPDLPMGISNINAAVNIDSPSSNFDDVVVSASKFGLRIGNNPIESRFVLKRPISDPDVDTVIKGTLKLDDLSKAFPLEDVQELSGLIKADVDLRARMSQIDRGDYENINVKGNMQAQGLVYRATGLPKVTIKNMLMAFTPQRVAVRDFDAQLGKSDMRGEGSINNILAYFSPKKTMTGSFTARSDFFDANEWAGEEASAPQPAPAGAPQGSPAEEAEVFDRFDFAVDMAFKQIVYEDYKLLNTVARGELSPVRMNIQEFSTQIGDSDMSASGQVRDIFDYLFEDGTLSGNLKMTSTLMNLNQFMSEGAEPVPATAAEEAALKPIAVPANIDMRIDAAIATVIYTNMTLRDFRGTLVIADQTVVLENVTTRTLGGNVAMAGAYDSNDIDNPSFNFKFDLNKLNFQQAFNTLNTFEKIAPIGRFINGIFNTSFIMEGKLGKDMMPDFNTLSAQGFLHTLNSVVSGFKPLQSIGNSLNVKEFKDDIQIKDSKNWFEIVNGVFELKEFDYAYKDIAMTIGGTHSLSQDMDYNIKTRIPRKLLESNAVGAAAGTGFNFLRGEAAKVGIKIDQSEFVNVLINLTGSATSPKAKLKLLGADGKAADPVGDARDAAKDALKNEVDKQKDEIKDRVEAERKKQEDALRAKADEAAAKAKAEAEKRAEELKKKAEDALRSKVDSATVKKAEEVLGGTKKDAEDKIKGELEKWNPLKKKKDGGN